MPEPLLAVEGLRAGYGASADVLRGVALSVSPGEVVTLLGRNGMGKTTTVRAITGELRPRAGRVRFDGRDTTGLPPHALARAGLGLVPEGRRVFPSLTVAEHLTGFARAASATTGRAAGWTRDRLYDLFPRLRERAGQSGGTLSGGEQQMLAVARALSLNPRLVVLDEATEGLAPLIRAEIWRCVEALRAERLAILLIDKNLDRLLRLADRHHVLAEGRVAWGGDGSAFARDRDALLPLLTA